MTPKQWAILSVTLALFGATAGLLGYARGHQQLGEPGLRVVPGVLKDEHGAIVASNLVDLPAQVLSYRSESMPITRMELDWLPSDTTYGYRRYLAPDGSWLDLRVVLMGSDRTSIHKPEYCLPGQGFQITRMEKRLIRIDRPHPYDLPVMVVTATRVVRKPDGGTQEVRAVFVYWFVADQQLTNDHLDRMWRMAWHLMSTGTLQRWAYVSCLGLCLPGQEEAVFQRLQAFLAAAVPAFQLALPAAGTP